MLNTPDDFNFLQDPILEQMEGFDKNNLVPFLGQKFKGRGMDSFTLNRRHTERELLQNFANQKEAIIEKLTKEQLQEKTERKRLIKEKKKIA